MASSWLNNLLGRRKKDSDNGEILLSDVFVGHRVKIIRLSGEQSVTHRLREMGFRESAVVDKVADSGAIICKVVDARVAISKKLAQNIFVEDMGKTGRSMSDELILLSQMSVGQRGVIRDFTADNDDYERIVEMGVTPGEEIEVIRYAPLGDPIEIRVRGYLLSLRKAEAERIKVARLV